MNNKNTVLNPCPNPWCNNETPFYDKDSNLVVCQNCGIGNSYETWQATSTTVAKAVRTALEKAEFVLTETTDYMVDEDFVGHEVVSVRKIKTIFAILKKQEKLI